MKRRHRVFWTILRPLVAVFCRIRFGYTFQKPKNLPKNYIVLSNHTTDYDPLFVGSAFRRQMYFVASEHISRWGFVSKLLDFVFDPILRYKGTVALTTAVDVLKRTRQGANVAIFAEGMRSWDGVTGPILPSTAKLVKSANCGLVTFKLTGGYFISPNWSEKSLRRGPVHGQAVGVYSAEEIAAMTPQELEELIARDLYEDAYARQESLQGRYKGKRLAEKLENVLFLCPHCGAFDTLRSQGDTVTCAACQNTLRYDEFGAVHGTEKNTVLALSRKQTSLAEKHVAENTPYTAPHGTLHAISKRQETFVAEGPVSLSATQLRCGDFTVETEKISDLAIHGRHELVFSVGRDYYELRPQRPVSAYKFFLYFRIYKNTLRNQ